MTSMIDIYEAGGAKVSEDRTKVEISSANPLKPFDILLRVVPTTVEMQYGEPEKVTFGVILDPEHYVAEQVFHQIYYDESVSMPVGQVRIAPRPVSGNITTIEQLQELPAGTVIVGPDFNNEVYQTDGEVWWATGQGVPWASDSLVARGPYHVLKLGER